MHSSFAEKLIKGEVYKIDDLVQAGSVREMKDSGEIRLKGNDYIVEDLDILYFRTSV